MADGKKQKIRRPKAATPRGFRDYFGDEVLKRQKMLSRITEIYRAYGFAPLESSAVETVEALGKFLPDVDRPNEGVFAWQDEDETWLALRYDLTAPLARVFAQHRNDLPTPYRRYAVGPVWRNEKPGPGRFRQFYQCDADTVGSSNMAADAEICAMLGEALEHAGIDRKDFLIRLNNRKILNGVMEVTGLLDLADPEAKATERGVVLRAIDKLDRLGAGGVRALLGQGREDPSGAYTEGAGLTDAAADLVMGFVEASGKNNAETLANLKRLVTDSETGLEGVRELEAIAELLEAQAASKTALIDPSVVRGLGYYTGPVYEAELTFDIIDEKGRKRQFGSVSGGGRYDDLVKRFTGQTVPATGISIGVDRLLAALETQETATSSTAPVLIAAMDRDRMGDYLAMAAELRNAGVAAEVYLANGNMGKQLKYADQRGCPVAVIEGQDEKDKGVVQLKDLALGAELAAQIASNEEWKAQPAQSEAARADLVSAVKALLARRAS
jgi:histidyl-tRNA synthetase